MVIQMYEEGGKCDERCYGAKGTHCSCGCNGKNHGAGLLKAIENEYGEDVADMVRGKAKELNIMSESAMNKAIEDML